MAALLTRAYVVLSDDYYLCPLPATQVTAEDMHRLLEPVCAQQQKLTPVYRPATPPPSGQEPALIAEGYEYRVKLEAVVAGRTVKWEERRLVVRSLALAAAQQHALSTRLEKASAEIAALNERRQGKKVFTAERELKAAGEQILAQYQVRGLLGLECRTQIARHEVRRYGSRPATTRAERRLSITARVDYRAVAQTKRRLGWRVYATNQPRRELSLRQAVLAYREQYLVERGFGRLKGKPLSLQPIYLDRDERVTGLLRVLVIALRVLCLLEFGARRRLHAEGEKLAGIYPGNPTRATARPTAEMMLRAFEGLTLTKIAQGKEISLHLTPLSAVQQRILQLLGLLPEIYLRLTRHASKPLFDSSKLLLKMSGP